MKLKFPPCEPAGHDIQLTMPDCPSPYIGIRCNCLTCGAEWLENYERVFVGEASTVRVEEMKPKLELI